MGYVSSVESQVKIINYFSERNFSRKPEGVGKRCSFGAHALHALQIGEQQGTALSAG